MYSQCLIIIINNICSRLVLVISLLFHWQNVHVPQNTTRDDDKVVVALLFACHQCKWIRDDSWIQNYLMY